LTNLFTDGKRPRRPNIHNTEISQCLRQFSGLERLVTTHIHGTKEDHGCHAASLTAQVIGGNPVDKFHHVELESLRTAVHVAPRENRAFGRLPMRILSTKTCIAIIPISFLFFAVPAEAASAPKKIATVEGITEYQFDNGLRLLLFPDNSQSKFTVNLTVLVGSRHEGYGESGMAHLLEHMVFKVLQDHGARFNGSTSVDRVNYYETLAASDENLEFALDLEADRLMNSFIRKSDLDSEMTVVRNEFERGENSPDRVLGQRIESAAYDWHNYGKSTIGNRSDIERVPIENLQAFYKKYYQPDNVVVIVAGKFSETKAL